jgi:signal transduction histidine kinase
MGVVNDKQKLIAELSHQINSPLAAIRNALYLASCQTDDPQLLRYLNLADEEITAITTILHATRAVIEQIADSEGEKSGALLCTRSAAA